MSAYNTMDKGVPGLKYGLGGRIESGWACAESGGIDFGAPCFSYVDEDKLLYNFYNDTAKLVFDGDFVASNVITITVNGVDAADVTFDTDHDTTAALVVAAVAALSGVECVLDSTDTDSRTFLIRTKGATAVVSEAITGGAGQVTGTVTYASGQVFVGVALYLATKVPSLSSSSLQGYEQYDSVNVMADGEVYVTAGATVEANTDAYITTTGTFGTSGIELDARYRESGASAALVRLNVKGQKVMTYGESF